MSLFTQWGCKEIINASGKMTALGGSAVDVEVAKSLSTSAREYVNLEELFDVAGIIIAKATGAEAACPTASATAGIVLAVAAMVAGDDRQRIEQIPFVSDGPREILLQKGHAVHYGASLPQIITLGGGIVREVGQVNYVEREQIISTISDQTAALFFVQSHHTVQKGMQPLQELISIGQAYRLPVIVDAAAEEDLRKYVQMGADLVIYSGGKALGGPTSGFLAGRADFIALCRKQYQGIGRAMKVGKEAIAGLITAIEQYQKKKPSVQQQIASMKWLVEQLTELPGITGKVVQDEAGREIYRAQLTIDSKQFGLSTKALIQQLEQGNPAIFTRNHYAAVNQIGIDPRPLLKGQEEQIVNRIREIYSQNKGD